MRKGLRRWLPNFARYLDDRIVGWRTGTGEGQRAVLFVLVALAGILFVGSLVEYMVFPAATFVVPLLLGSMTLRYRPLLTLVGVTTLFLAITVTKENVLNGPTAGRVSTLVTMAVVVAIMLFEARQRRSGLPGAIGEAMLVDLNNRLQRQGYVPLLPEQWRSQSAMSSAGGAKFAGDFLVADLSEDGRHLEMVLVDVCGKGVAAGTQSLQLAGALGGLIGSLPPQGLFAAANHYLLRQRWDEGFATAVHVVIDLDTGAYSLISAGHPPVLIWTAKDQEWRADQARGIALGILERPEFNTTSGVLEPGDALLFYTDGVVETRRRGVGEGVDWLRLAAARSVAPGFDGAARRILEHVKTTDDDRAVLVIDRIA